MVRFVCAKESREVSKITAGNTKELEKRLAEKLKDWGTDKLWLMTKSGVGGGWWQPGDVLKTSQHDGSDIEQ